MLQDCFENIKFLEIMIDWLKERLENLENKVLCQLLLLRTVLWQSSPLPSLSSLENNCSTRLRICQYRSVVAKPVTYDLWITRIRI